MQTQVFYRQTVPGTGSGLYRYQVPGSSTGILLLPVPVAVPVGSYVPGTDLTLETLPVLFFLDTIVSTVVSTESVCRTYVPAQEE